MTRRRPASASGPASARRADPFVVRVRSTSPPSGRRIAASIAMRSGRSRRTSGSPPVIRSFSTPSETNDPGRPLDLLEGQDLVARQERVVLAEDLLGHAVGAPEVAPIGHRDAQVAHRPTERVGRPGAAIEGAGDVHRAMVAGNDAGAARRYHRRGPLVPPADCTAPTLAATMRPSPGYRADPSDVAVTRICSHGPNRNTTGFQASLVRGPERHRALPEDDATQASAPDEPPIAEETVTPDMIDTTTPAPARRPTKFMADLSRAMQTAAETSRDETMARFIADAKTVVEEIHETRRRSRPPPSAVAPTTTWPPIREWSKAEIARIREETEARIAARKRALDGEIDAHAAVVEARVSGSPGPSRRSRPRWTPSSSACWPRRTRPASRPWPRRCPTRPTWPAIAASIAEPAVEPFDRVDRSVSPRHRSRSPPSPHGRRGRGRRSRRSRRPRRPRWPRAWTSPPPRPRPARSPTTSRTAARAPVARRTTPMRS